MSRSMTTVRFQADARPARKQARTMSREEVLAIVHDDDTAALATDADRIAFMADQMSQFAAQLHEMIGPDRPFEFAYASCAVEEAIRHLAVAARKTDATQPRLMLDA